jgi:DNA-binding transcriptional LysR family regulator
LEALVFDIHQLNVFLVAAETLNFTRAGQRLHMTQPSVSQHVQALEAYFDMPLFARNGRNLELTEAGLALLPLARQAVALSQRVDETMESLKGETYGHLMVGCSTTPGKYILPQILARFHSYYPHVRVTCQVSPQAEALAALSEGEAHFALFSHYNEKYPHVEALPFLCDPIALVAPTQHVWAEKGEIEPHELLGADLIMREPGSGTYAAVSEALAPFNIAMHDLNILITLGNAEAIALAVQEGIGAGFISKMVVDRLCPSNVAIVKVRGMDICRQIYIGRNTRRQPTEAQAAFWSFLSSQEVNLPLPERKINER